MATPPCSPPRDASHAPDAPHGASRDNKARDPVVLGPESLTWRYAGENIGYMLSGAVLILQVAHPVVGAGVAEFSTYKTDPWGRLERTTRHVTDFIYGGAVVAPKSAANLREMHRAIKGTDTKGRRYAALDPEAYAWVHLTLYYAIVRAQELFATPLTLGERARFYDEWLTVGDLLGVRRVDMPADLPAFDAYIERMIATRLEDNDVVRHLLGPGVLEVGRPPMLRAVPAFVWRAFYFPIGRVMRFATIGGMPESLRQKLGLAWSRSDAGLFRVFARAVRAATQPLPEALRYGPLALRAIRAARAGAASTAVHGDASGVLRP